MGTSQTSSECRSPARRGPSGSAVLRLVRHCCTGHVAHDEVVDRRRVVPGRVGRHLEITNVEVVRVHRPIGVVPDYLGSDFRIVRIEQRNHAIAQMIMLMRITGAAALAIAPVGAVAASQVVRASQSRFGLSVDALAVVVGLILRSRVPSSNCAPPRARVLPFWRFRSTVIVARPPSNRTTSILIMPPSIASGWTCRTLPPGNANTIILPDTVRPLV